MKAIDNDRWGFTKKMTCGVSQKCQSPNVGTVEWSTN